LPQQFKDFQSLSPLFSLKKLEFLTLSSTSLSQLPNYRTWLIHNIPSLRYIDFNKVKQSERDSAKKLYEDKEGNPTDLAASMSGQSADGVVAKPAKTFDAGGAPESGAGRGLTDEQKKRVRKAIENAGTLEEIQRLKRMLMDGFIPDEKTLKALSGK